MKPGATILPLKPRKSVFDALSAIAAQATSHQLLALVGVFSIISP